MKKPIHAAQINEGSEISNSLDNSFASLSFGQFTPSFSRTSRALSERYPGGKDEIASLFIDLGDLKN